MGYQSKTYSLSDEVVGVIEMARANGETPNKFLRRVLGIDDNVEFSMRVKPAATAKRNSRPLREKGEGKR